MQMRRGVPPFVIRRRSCCGRQPRVRADDCRTTPTQLYFVAVGLARTSHMKALAAPGRANAAGPMVGSSRFEAANKAAYEAALKND
jgi:hypothetical protein